MTTAPNETTRTLSNLVRMNVNQSSIRNWLPLIVIAVLTLYFSLASEHFATLRNLTNITGQASTLLIVCLGATFVVQMGSIDLSVGAMVLLTGAICALFVNATGAGLLVVPFAAVVGAMLGLINGSIVSLGRIQSFVVTLGTLSVFSGTALQLLQGRVVQFRNASFENLAIGQLVPNLPNIALCALIAWVLVVFVSRNTKFGRYMFVIGGGELVAKTAGLPVNRYKVYAFVVSGMFAGIGAALAVARMGAAGPTLGSDLLLNSLAAIVVGGTSLAGGSGGPHRTMLGVLIIAILDNGLNLLGISAYTQLIIKGAVVIAAVRATQVASRDLVIK